MLSKILPSLQTMGKPVPLKVLEQLFWLRCLAISSQTVTVLLVHFVLMVHLPLGPMFAIIITELAISLATRRHASQRISASETEITLHLIVDVFLLAGLLYYSGGFTNPFVSFLLFYIALSAVLLSAKQCFSIALLTIILYTLLVMFYIPLIPRGGQFVDVFDLHLSGMWVNYILSALLMASFVTGLAKIARDRSDKLARAREKMLQNEHLLLMGTLSAGVAHEINTPLSSIKMLLGEMENSSTDDPWVLEQIPVLRKQTDICISRIKELTETIKNQHETERNQPDLKQFTDNLIRRWSAMRPEIGLQTDIDTYQGSLIRSSGILMQVIINLLNNAADASLENGKNKVVFSVSNTSSGITFQIDDFGKGFTQQQLEQAGKLVNSSKTHGLGVGLMLSHATLDLLGGTLLLQPKQDGTTTVVIINSAEPE